MLHAAAHFLGSAARPPKPVTKALHAYDRKSHVGTLDRALDQAQANDWIIVSMKDDWKTIFPPKYQVPGQNRPAPEWSPQLAE